jgi:hypothetical protein
MITVLRVFLFLLRLVFFAASIFVAWGAVYTFGIVALDGRNGTGEGVLFSVVSLSLFLVGTVGITKIDRLLEAALDRRQQRALAQTRGSI